MKAALKRLKPFVPSPLLRAAKRIRGWVRRKSWEREVAKRGEDARFDRATLAEDLRALGLEPGRDVFIHSAMSKLGLVEGGAEAVIGAICDVVGPDATLLMPCYPMKQNMLETMKEPGPFDVANDESTMGKITRVFRLMPGTLRSAHPTHSVAARGPRAAEYVAHHHESGSPCGPGSPFALLSEHDGVVLALGSGVGKVTSHHTVEDQMTDFPVKVYLPEPMQKLVRFTDGEERMVSVRVHDPALAAIRVDNRPEKEAEIHARMKQRGILREGQVGLATCHLFAARALDRMHRDGLKSGLTIYET